MFSKAALMHRDKATQKSSSYPLVRQTPRGGRFFISPLLARRCSSSAVVHRSYILVIALCQRLAVPIIIQPQQWQEGCQNRAGGGHPEVCTGTSYSGGGVGTLLWWNWGRGRWISRSVKVGDEEAGKCCLSLVLRCAHEKLSDPVASSLNLIYGGH